MEADTTARERRNCSPYGPEELARFKELLMTQQNELLRSCQGMSHVAMRKSDDAGGDDSVVTDDPADMAADTYEQDFSLNMLGRAQVELAGITQALDRIEKRSYGLCLDCSQPIPIARLEALPTAGTCVACKSKSEAA
jgi:RNA polymerase-binding protein DksA